ncbi:hypothetical protein COV11_04060 [Candidatus Woesearchaeota archaeon CG10_big_fil_rev_8_21_14_0_10_30_7]|nr:MAG: hypothetical protein COV11_04060 [Candidatus Woesearchaeota archaeon CG10_big_fil_rev_8_21_14_0_10_30_7]
MNSKSMTASVLEDKLSFENNPELKRKYENIRGDIRFGLLLEYLDLFAGETAIRHADDGRFLKVVTASIDHMDICKPVGVQKDLYFKSIVSYVGKSSINVDITISTSSEKTGEVYFTMVALDSKFKPVEVKKVIPNTAEEQLRYSNAEKRREEFKLKRTEHAKFNFLPGEWDLIKKIRSEQGKLMSNTRVQHMAPMYPQDQNIYGKMFGGYLMKEAFQLAWTAAYNFLDFKVRPVIVSIDRIDFLKAVEIGDIVDFNAVICHTGTTSLSVKTSISKIHSNINNGKLTNDCYFTFVATDDKGQSQQVPRVIPVTPEECQEFIQTNRLYLSRKA